MPIIVTPPSVEFADYYDLLLQELPGCTTAMVNRNLLEVAREFCQKTSIWRTPLDAIDVVAAQAAYNLIVPADSEIVRLTRLEVNGVLLWRHEEEARPGVTEDEPEYTSTEPPFSLSADLAAITLALDEVPTAAVVGGLVIEAALKPTTDAAALPAFLLVQHSEALRYGTLARLMKMSKKPWGDRPLAMDYEGRWNSALNFAAYQAQVGNTRQRLRTKSWG